MEKRKLIFLDIDGTLTEPGKLYRQCGGGAITVEDTIAFGDSMNDLEMLWTAGVGICMGKGSLALKALAHKVCPPLNEDGH